MFKFSPKKEKENNEYSLYDKYFDLCDVEEDETLYKKQLYVIEEDKFTKKEQSNLTLKHKGLLDRLILEDFSVYPLKKDPMESLENTKVEESSKKKTNSDDKDLKKVDELEKFAEDENEFIKDLHRINYLTFSPFSLSFFNKNDKDSYLSSEKILKEKENENKIFKMINFDYNNYEFNEELLFNICHGFVDPDKLKEENIAGARKNSLILGLNSDLINKVDEKDEIENSNSNLKSEDMEEKKEEVNKEELLINEINNLIEEINTFIKKKEKIEFYKEEISKYNESKKGFDENLEISNEDKKIFYQKWLDKFHEVEIIYKNYKVQIQRTETIKKVREEKMKKEIEEARIRKINEDNKFIEELNKIKDKALRKKKKEEKGIFDNSSLYSDNSSMTYTSGSLGTSNYSNFKGTNGSRMTNTYGRKSIKKKSKKTERFDWMIKKSDNYFDQY